MFLNAFGCTWMLSIVLIKYYRRDGDGHRAGARHNTEHLQGLGMGLELGIGLGLGIDIRL